MGSPVLNARPQTLVVPSSSKSESSESSPTPNSQRFTPARLSMSTDLRAVPPELLSTDRTGSVLDASATADVGAAPIEVQVFEAVQSRKRSAAEASASTHT